MFPNCAAACGDIPKVPVLSPPRAPRPAVFLDRDGTICEEVGYLNHVSRLQIYPHTAGAIRRLNEAGVPAIVVTNQSGVSRGMFPESLVTRSTPKDNGGVGRLRCAPRWNLLLHAHESGRMQLPQTAARASRTRGSRARHRLEPLVCGGRPLRRRGTGTRGGRAWGAGADGLRKRRLRIPSCSSGRDSRIGCCKTWPQRWM